MDIRTIRCVAFFLCSSHLFIYHTEREKTSFWNEFFNFCCRSKSFQSIHFSCGLFIHPHILHKYILNLSGRSLLRKTYTCVCVVGFDVAPQDGAYRLAVTQLLYIFTNKPWIHQLSSRSFCNFAKILRWWCVWHYSYHVDEWGTLPKSTFAWLHSHTHTLWWHMNPFDSVSQLNMENVCSSTLLNACNFEQSLYHPKYVVAPKWMYTFTHSHSLIQKGHFSYLIGIYLWWERSLHNIKPNLYTKSIYAS